MLASITPLGQRGSRFGWRVTAGAFLLGAVGAGAAAGALLGLAGSLLVAGVGAQPRLVVFALGTLAAVALDAAPWRVPGPRRQVDERWRTQYRGWVWGSGYGVQLGVGVATVVLSASAYLALFAAFVVADAERGALIMGLFGLIRGIQPLATWRLRRPEQLVRFHQRLTCWRTGARTASCGLLGVILASALLGALT